MTNCLVCGAYKVAAQEMWFPSSTQTKITYRCGSVKLSDTVCGKKFVQSEACQCWRHPREDKEITPQPEQIPTDLLQALNTLAAEHLGDFIHHVREAEGRGWDGPRVTAWADACKAVEKYTGGGAE